AAPAGSWLMVPVALCAWLLPGASTAIVLAAAGLGSAVLALRPGVSDLPLTALALVVVAEVWFALCALALARQYLRRGGETAEPRALWAVLGLAWAIAWAALAVDGTSTVAVQTALRSGSAAVLAPLLLAAAWSIVRRTEVRRLAVVPGLASALALLAGT